MTKRLAQRCSSSAPACQSASTSPNTSGAPTMSRVAKPCNLLRVGPRMSDCSNGPSWKARSASATSPIQPHTSPTASLRPPPRRPSWRRQGWSSAQIHRGSTDWCTPRSSITGRASTNPCIEPSLPSSSCRSSWSSSTPSTGFTMSTTPTSRSWKPSSSSSSHSSSSRTTGLPPANSATCSASGE